MDTRFHFLGVVSATEPGASLMPDQKDLQMWVVVSLVVLLGGLALALEGFYFAGGSGLLFGSYICFGGFACGNSYEFLRSMFWIGIYSLLPGLALITVGVMILRRMLRRKGQGDVRIFASRRQKRIIMRSAMLGLVLVVFFLAPIVPFITTYSQQSLAPSFPHVDICYQDSSSVISPVFDYWGLETPSRALFGIGNFVFVRCTVVSSNG
jgi:hypothetical protein